MPIRAHKKAGDNYGPGQVFLAVTRLAGERFRPVQAPSAAAP